MSLIHLQIQSLCVQNWVQKCVNISETAYYRLSSITQSKQIFEVWKFEIW